MPRKSTTTDAASTKKTPVKKTAAAKKTSAAKKPAARKVTTVKNKATAKKTPAKNVSPKVEATKKPSEKKLIPGKKSAAKSAAVSDVVAASVSESNDSEGKARLSTKTSDAKQHKPVTKATTLLEPQMMNIPGKPIVFGDTTIEPYDISKAEEYMNTAQKQHFINILQAWKRALMQEVDRTVTLLQDEVKNLPDMTDRASQEEEFSVALRTRDRERKLIRKIEKTLLRIREDEYGFCDTCGVDIGIRRLEARPTANLCIDCKTLDEIVERQTRG